ncbi:MAG: outer membrane protein assembly factor BamD [Thermodesulfobacteriota bacterium]|nr:outer membrane protein assembly factor BamD [Thermodesulfobacteriota bacterium]
MDRNNSRIWAITGNFLIVLFLCVMPVGLSGCTAIDQLIRVVWPDEGAERPETAESLAMDGLNDLNHGDYYSALDAFEKLKDRYPFSRFSLLAELKSADCKFYKKDYGEALLLYEEFENNHPTNEAIPYVLFQIGMCHFRRIDTKDRDTKVASEAIASFSRLNRTFPGSPYFVEADKRIKAANDFLADHELYVAIFYMKTGEYDQAMRRLEYILTHFPQALIVPDAEELLAALQAGNPPKRKWKSWLPELSLSDLKSFASFDFRPGIMKQ